MYVHLDNIPTEEIIKLIESHSKNHKKITYRGFNINIASLRLLTFKTKGLECVSCGVKGSHFKIESYTKNSNSPHFGLYTKDNILMTKDHIIPKSKGGLDGLENLQTMCTICNRKKGSIVTSDDLVKGKYKEFKDDYKRSLS